MRWLDSVSDSTDMNLSKLREIVKDRGAWRAVQGLQSLGLQRVGYDLVTTTTAPVQRGGYVLRGDMAYSYSCGYSVGKVR